MEITVNNQTVNLPDPSSVSFLLSAILRVPETGIAVAINQDIVPRSGWSEHALRQGDRVVLIKATQGG